MSLKHPIARAVQPNAGTAARYRRALLAEIAKMITNVEELVSARRESAPPILAEDAYRNSRSLTTPAIEMRKELDKLALRWGSHFADVAPGLARKFVLAQFDGTSNSMRHALKAAGWVVEFTMTPAVKDAFEASLAENVGLIKSIPSQYLHQVEGIVMRGYASGGDLHTMVREIRALYPKAKDRAVLIARDQSNKANAVVTRARQKELQITEAIWMHSHAGKEPRPTHVRMNGKRYEVEKGMYDSAVQRFVFPGELINCRCTSRSVLPWTPAPKSGNYIDVSLGGRK